MIGCPDDEWGELVVAVIIAKTGMTADEDTICAFCREHLASYKVPRRVVFVESFPQNALGKIQKAKLRERLCG